jgi:septum site-determining protein MinC
LRLFTFHSTMAPVSEDPPQNGYDIKSADLSLLALVLKTTDVPAVSAALQRQMAETPGFFDQDPVLVDVGALEPAAQDNLALTDLLLSLRANGLVPLAIKGAQAGLLMQAKAQGLVDASDARIRRSVPLGAPLPAAPTPLPEAAQQAEPQTPSPVPAPWGAMVIDKPLRSGQQVYAKGRDLIVLAMVNVGAEVIADGHVHVYGALRGKAIAGARGNTQAQIFALVMEPELISIAGVYRTSENALPPEVLGQAAQVSLQTGPDGDKLRISALKT